RRCYREAPRLRPGALTRRVQRAHAPLVARARRKAAHLRGGTRHIPVENHSARTAHGGHLHAVRQRALDRLPDQNRRKRNAHRARKRCAPCPSMKGEISPPLASMPISFHQRVKRVVPQPNSKSVCTLLSFLISWAIIFFCQTSARL